MAEILESLFGSKSKARMLRFFLLNPDQEYSIAEAAKKNMLKVTDAKRFWFYSLLALSKIFSAVL